MQFQNKAAISTGAASGMGLLFSQCWAAEGGNVLMCDVNEAVLAEKVAEINAKGVGRAVALFAMSVTMSRSAQPGISAWRSLAPLI